jgi:hypothetical protein
MKEALGVGPPFSTNTLFWFAGVCASVWPRLNTRTITMLSIPQHNRSNHHNTARCVVLVFESRPHLLKRGPARMSRERPPPYDSQFEAQNNVSQHHRYIMHNSG